MNLTLKGTTKLPAPTAISVFVGIDWADAKHDICLLLLGEEDGRHVLIENTLYDWVLKLIEEFDTRGNIYVATEKARGALLYTLMQYPQLTLFHSTRSHRKVTRDPASERDQKRPLGLPPASRIGQALSPSRIRHCVRRSRPPRGVRAWACIASAKPSISQRFSRTFCSVFGEQYLSP